jgi:hypothetical protein
MIVRTAFIAVLLDAFVGTGQAQGTICDDDTNNRLDAAICGSSGSTITIASVDNLTDIDNCNTILGSLYIHAKGATGTLTLPSSLQTITGGLFCNGTGADYPTEQIQAMGLTSVLSNDTSAISSSGLVFSDYSDLTNLLFPNLTTIGSNFVVVRNPALYQLDGFDGIYRT